MARRASGYPRVDGYWGFPRDPLTQSWQWFAVSDYRTRNRACPMSLDVLGTVQSGQMEDSGCILYGNYVDSPAQEAVYYTFSAGK